MIPVTVTILTKNEVDKLADCLRTVQWADEVLVIDSGSTDGTIELARGFGARVVEMQWRGFAAQKNLAAGLAAHDWVLNVDADERVGRGLAAGVQALDPRVPCYEVVRRSDFLGIEHRPVHRVREERLVRLYDRTRARFDDVLVHEKVRPTDGSTAGRMPGALYHEGFRGLGDFVDRLNRYSQLLADERPGAPSAHTFLIRPAVRLVWDLLVQRNILDGRRGLTISMAWALHDFLVIAKQYERTLSPQEAFDRGDFAAGTTAKRDLRA